MKDPIQIVCTIDDNYAQHCAVLLASIFKNNPNHSFKIFIVHNGLRVDNVDKLCSFGREHLAELEFIKIDEEQLKHVPISAHVTLATYYRLLLPKVLPESTHKILFLDCDMLVRSDLGQLWATDIQDVPLAACSAPLNRQFKENLGLQADSDYFNAGVLLVNILKWREEQVSERALDFTNKHADRIVFWDQDVLNFLFEGQWLRLPYTWNAGEHFFNPNPELYDLKLDNQVFYEVQTNPAIVHFTGKSKPWHYMSRHPFKMEYYQYLRETPWQNFVPADKSYGNMLRKHKLFPKALDRYLARRNKQHL